MAIVGGAVFPAIQGAVADATSIQTSFLVPVIGFLYIAFYGINGSKVKSRAEQ
jgi:FHS family L-fucose permease-like MFS transporter